MPQYTTSQDAMAAGAARVQDATVEISGQLGTLRSEVETMFGGWRGEAAGSFARVHEAFETHAGRINEALRRMHQSLLATYRTYGEQESTQTQAFAGLAGRING